MKSLIDKNTKAIVVLNPSNPCGSSFSKKHVGEILAGEQKDKYAVIQDSSSDMTTFLALFQLRSNSNCLLFPMRSTETWCVYYLLNLDSLYLRFILNTVYIKHPY